MKWESVKRERHRRRAELASALVSYALDLPADDGRARSREAVLGRQAAMYLCHVACGMSLTQAAYAFQRDRSTISHACHTVENRRDDPLFDAWIEALTLSMRATPGTTPEAEGGNASMLRLAIREGAMT